MAIDKIGRHFYLQGVANSLRRLILVSYYFTNSYCHLLPLLLMIPDHPHRLAHKLFLTKPSYHPLSGQPNQS